MHDVWLNGVFVFIDSPSKDGQLDRFLKIICFVH